MHSHYGTILCVDYMHFYRLITERFSEVNCFRRIGESDREAHALNRIFWPICRFFVRKLQVGDKVN